MDLKTLEQIEKFLVKTVLTTPKEDVIDEFAK